MKRLLTITLLPLLGLPLNAQKASKPSKFSFPHVEKDLVYKTVGERELHLDIFYPDAQPKGLYPTVIYSHGGGWAAGSKNSAGANMGKVTEGLVNNGFCVVAVQYRLYKKGGDITIKDCVTDCKDAIRYLSKKSTDLHTNPDLIFTFGDSAGGQIAQMLLLAPPASLPGDAGLKDAPYTTIAGVSWYGPCDFEKTELFNHNGREGFRDRFGPRILRADTKPEDKLTLYREMSPINYLTKDSPPLLMLQGDGDTTIPVHHAHHMMEKAKKISAPVETVIVKNAGHNWRKADGVNPTEPSRNEIIEATINFLTKHLPK